MPIHSNTESLLELYSGFRFIAALCGASNSVQLVSELDAMIEPGFDLIPPSIISSTSNISGLSAGLILSMDAMRNSTSEDRLCWYARMEIEINIKMREKNKLLVSQN